MIARIGVIGLGKLGLPVAEAMAARHEVYGYDTARVSSDSVRILGTMIEVVDASDVLFLALPTPHHPDYDGSRPTSHLPNRDFDYSAVTDVLDQIDAMLYGPKPVVLISTVLPGTVRRILRPRLRTARLIYNPYLIAMGTVAEDFVNPEMIMIGNEDGTMDGDSKMLVDFYQGLCGRDVRVVHGTWEEMECTKIFYNTFISAKLSITNMIQDVAQRIGHANVDIIAGALAGSDRRISSGAYMKPGMGDGGPCHPRDNIALRWLADRLELGYDLFDSIMRSREVQARNLAAELVSHGLPVVIWGESFKPGVPYTDGSYARLVGHYVSELGGELAGYDFILGDRATYLISHDVDQGSNISRVTPGSIIVDPWRKSKPVPGTTLIRWGDSRPSGSQWG